MKGRRFGLPFRFRGRGAWSWFSRLFSAILLFPVSYFVAALVGTVLPASVAERARSGETVTIRVIASSIHTDLVLPVRAFGYDLSGLIAAPAFSAREADLAYWRGTVSHVAISWGSRAFFEGVPTWDRLRPQHIIAALIDDSAVHVTLLGDPVVLVDAVEIEVGADGYAALVAGLDDALRGGLGDPQPITGLGYSEHDAFYEGAQTYHAFYTCNVWMGDLLATAGIQAGAWTPHPQGLMWRLER